MDNPLKKNGLKLHRVKTEVRPLFFEGKIDEFLENNFKEDGYIIAFLDYRVLAGLFRDGKCIFYNHGDLEEKYLLRLRLFNGSKELYLWRSADGFKARLRIDGEGEETPVVDAHQVLWGTKARPLGEFTELTEERGTTLIVPLKNLEINDKHNRLFIQTRNYVGYTEAHQATYVDCRFMGFSTEDITAPEKEA